MAIETQQASKTKVRNYSFKNSKRLSSENMTEINGIKIPSMPGSCYHAIICVLAQHKDSFCQWRKIIELTEKYMLQYGGTKAWERFCNKSNVKSCDKRIKDNAHTLTRTGKDCYGYRLHELGMCIYYFKDGAMLLTGGQLKNTSHAADCWAYVVELPHGRGLQHRYRGTTMTFREYKKFLDVKFITSSCEILDVVGIREIRAKDIERSHAPPMTRVRVKLSENYDQKTANRLDNLGLIVNDANGEEIKGMIRTNKMLHLRRDPDVLSVEGLSDGRV